MRKRGGFTLLEVLVALAILAIALTAVMRAVGIASQQADAVRERMLAQWVAENRLNEHRAKATWLEAGSAANGEVEQAGLKLSWREEVKATPNPLFRRIEISVFRSGDEARLIMLTGFLSRAAQ